MLCYTIAYWTNDDVMGGWIPMSKQSCVENLDLLKQLVRTIFADSYGYDDSHSHENIERFEFYMLQKHRDLRRKTTTLVVCDYVDTDFPDRWHSVCSWDL
jgi:hypothetical protein